MDSLYKPLSPTTASLRVVSISAAGTPTAAVDAPEHRHYEHRHYEHRHYWGAFRYIVLSMGIDTGLLHLKQVMTQPIQTKTLEADQPSATIAHQNVRL